MRCKFCGSTRVVKCGKHPAWKGGKLHYKQYYLCNNCGRQSPKVRK